MPDPVSWPTIAALLLFVAGGFVVADLAYHRVVHLAARVSDWWRFFRRQPVVDDRPKVREL